jgi:membrane protein implicated in regulation of membrane protease activity
MTLLIAIFLAYFAPSTTWSVVILTLGVVGEVGEIVWGRRLARRWRPKTGPTTMVGRTAEVVSPLRPRGQVRIDGELWEARSTAAAGSGERVRIDGIEGLTLVVTPEAQSVDHPGRSVDD